MDLNDYPSTKSIPWKPVVIGAVGLVVVIVLIVVIVRWVKKDAQMNALSEVVQQEVVASMDDCESARDPEGCRQAEITDLASKHESVETCELLDSVEQRDNCYWAVAREASDATYCSAISVPDDVTRCSDGINLRLAIDHNDGGFCENIIDPSRKEVCVDLFLEPLSPANCVERAPELCDDIGLYTQARATLDVLLCREIVENDMRESCKESVADLLTIAQAQDEEDFDEDGLTKQEEETYGTDPENPDTDSDGYLDGAEVSAGYNPLGAGRL